MRLGSYPEKSTGGIPVNITAQFGACREAGTIRSSALSCSVAEIKTGTASSTGEQLRCWDRAMIALWRGPPAAIFSDDPTATSVQRWVMSAHDSRADVVSALQLQHALTPIGPLRSIASSSARHDMPPATAATRRIRRSRSRGFAMVAVPSPAITVRHRSPQKGNPNGSTKP